MNNIQAYLSPVRGDSNLGVLGSPATLSTKYQLSIFANNHGYTTDGKQRLIIRNTPEGERGFSYYGFYPMVNVLKDLPADYAFDKVEYNGLVARGCVVDILTMSPFHRYEVFPIVLCAVVKGKVIIAVRCQSGDTIIDDVHDLCAYICGKYDDCYEYKQIRDCCYVHKVHLMNHYGSSLFRPKQSTDIIFYLDITKSVFTPVDRDYVQSCFLQGIDYLPGVATILPFAERYLKSRDEKWNAVMALYNIAGSTPPLSPEYIIADDDDYDITSNKLK
jgi:hypothetical protein